MHEDSKSLSDEATKLTALHCSSAIARRVATAVPPNDVHATFAALRGAGVDITQEPVEQPYGTDFGIRDPFGNHVRISQPNAATPAEVQDAADDPEAVKRFGGRMITEAPIRPAVAHPCAQGGRPAAVHVPGSTVARWPSRCRGGPRNPW